MYIYIAAPLDCKRAGVVQNSYSSLLDSSLSTYHMILVAIKTNFVPQSSNNGIRFPCEMGSVSPHRVETRPG